MSYSESSSICSWFLQVQNRPQAIFTSFKLEKNGKSASPLPVTHAIDNSFQVNASMHQTPPENHADEVGSSKEVSASFPSHNRLNDSGGSLNNERKRRLSFSSSTSTEPEKVSIVRAAGTFFPQNCNANESETSSPPQVQPPPPPPPTIRRKSKESVDYSKKCCVAGCNEANDSAHLHCDDCTEVFDDESSLMTHITMKHKPSDNAVDSMSNHEGDASQELMQNFAKQIIKQSENLFNMESFMSPAASVMSNLAAINQQPLAMGGGVGGNAVPNDAGGFSYSDQLSAQIQTLCLAQLAALYQNNPIMYQHLYPLLGAVEHLKQQDPVATQRMFMPQTASPLQMNANPFGAFDLSNLTASAAAAAASKKATAAAAAVAAANKLQKQGVKLLGKSDTKANKSGAADGLPSNRAASNFKIFKDEPIPKGYLKFKFNEDCGFPQCGYSNLQSHFHCCRTDCHYSFCDKTRFVQVNQKHIDWIH